MDLNRLFFKELLQCFFEEFSDFLSPKAPYHKLDNWIDPTVDSGQQVQIGNEFPLCLPYRLE